MERDRPPQSQTRPDPDPTVLTTAALMREVANLKAALRGQMEGIEKVLLSRIVGIEKAIDVAHGDAVRIPTLLQDAVANLRTLTWSRLDVVTERFRGIKTQFKERDTRVEQTAKESKEALQAALTAQKEAVSEQQKSNTLAINKSEQTTKEQITSLGSRIDSNTKTTDEKINDLKVRLAVIEGVANGRNVQRDESRAAHTDIWGYVVGAFGILLAVISLVALITGHGFK